MPLPNNLDNLALYTPLPALQNFGSGTFNISVSGTIASAAGATFSNSVSFSRANAVVRLYITQNIVPAGIGVDYTTGALLPSPPYGSSSQVPFVFIGCSVAGNPSVTSIIPSIKSKFTSSNITTTISIYNPYAGTMTLTTTVFTIRYIAYVPTDAFSS